MKKIIIIGATSGIGRGLAEVYSQEDYLIGSKFPILGYPLLDGRQQAPV